MNPSIQELLNTNELRAYATGGELPEDFRSRLANLVEMERFLTSPNVHCYSTGALLSEFLTFEEMNAYLTGGELPGDLRLRTATLLEHDCCGNCGGQLCMSCALREMHERCVSDCPDCCLPAH